MFRGLFIGIDRYKAPVTRLSCARNDALALSTLFEDSLGGEVTTLLDEDASRQAIVDALEALSTAGSDDLVVVAFSGHGTEDHALVPVDVRPDDLDGSCIGLDEVARLLDAVPATNLLVFIDCCFSGGFGGARVFAPHSSRSPVEDRSPVEALASGHGRVVLTASGAGEPALETLAIGHGLLTHHLLRGLQGEDGLASGGRLRLFELFQFVTTAVVDSARRLSETQTPTVYGSVEGAPTLAVLAPGPKFANAFPHRVRPQATADWSSLTPYGISDEVLSVWSTEMPSINALQLEAINQYGVLDEKSLLVVAPTASGKTMIGELAALKAVGGGARSVVLLPLKALVNDKYDYMRRAYGDQLLVVRATGDHSDQVGAIMSGQFDVALLTYEKFLNLILGSPYIMRGISVVVVDEVQTVSDPNRGPSLEFLLTLLRSGHGRSIAPQIVALSAVIGDSNGLERWIGGALLRSEERPVPLREAIVDASGSLQIREADGTTSSEAAFIRPLFGGGSQSSKPWIIPLVQRLVGENKKVIVFRSFKGETVGTARYLADSLGLASARDVHDRLPGEDRSASSEDLRYVVDRGVGFHNADLDPDERQALEEAFRDPDSPLRVLVATTTLAMGVNTPAEAVVISGLMHPGNEPYRVAEYKNMVGRAGRLGHAEAGESYLIATSDLAPTTAWQHYVLGSPEAVVSHFLAASTDPQTLALRSLAALGSSVTEDDLVELLENSFAVWLRQEQGLGGWDRARLVQDLDGLVSAGLLDREPDGRLTLTELGRYAGESGLEVRSVTQVASALRFAPPNLSAGDLITLAQVTRELDAVYLPSNRRSIQERQRWVAALPRLGVSLGLINGLHVGGGETVPRAKRATACLLYISSTPLINIEQNLMQHLRESSVGGPIRAVAGRTRDVIEAVGKIAQFQGRQVDEGLTTNLGLQLELGIPESLVELAETTGTALNRGQYLALLNAGVTSWLVVREQGEEGLTQIIGAAGARQLMSRDPQTTR